MGRMMSRYKIAVALLVTFATCTTWALSTTPEIAASQKFAEAQELCLEHYRRTYRKGQAVQEDLLVKRELLSMPEVRRSHFARDGVRFEEPMYLHIIISKRRPKKSVGGAAHYLVSPESGKIIARYHER